MAARRASTICSGGGRGDDAIDALHGGVFEHAGGFAGGVAHDGAAGRIGGVAGDAGELQRQGVGQGHVAVQAIDEDGVIAGGLRRSTGGWAGAPASSSRGPNRRR